MNAMPWIVSQQSSTMVRMLCLLFLMKIVKLNLSLKSTCILGTMSSNQTHFVSPVLLFVETHKKTPHNVRGVMNTLSGRLSSHLSTLVAIHNWPLRTAFNPATTCPQSLAFDLPGQPGIHLVLRDNAHLNNSPGATCLGCFRSLFGSRI